MLWNVHFISWRGARRSLGSAWLLCFFVLCCHTMCREKKKLLELGSWKETIAASCTFHSLFTPLGQPVRSHHELLYEKSLSSTCGAKKCYTCWISPSDTCNLCFCCMLTPTDLVTVPASQSQTRKPALSFFNVDFRYCCPLKIHIHGTVLFHQFSCIFLVVSQRAKKG